MVCLILLYSSCQTDELMNESQNSFENEIVSKSKEWLETNNPDLTILQYTKNILWENAIFSNGEKGEILEVPLVLLDHIGTMNNNPQSLKDFHRLLFMRDNKNNLKVYHLQIIAKPSTFNNLSSDFNFYTITATFDGTVTLSDSNKQTVDYLRFADGEKIKPSKTSKEAALTCLYFGWWYEDGSFRPISLISCTSGGGSETGYGYQGGGGGSATTSNTQTIEDNIDYTKLDSCTKAVMEQLKNATNSDISSILEKFVASDIYKVTMVMGAMTNPVNFAETTKISKNNYFITVTQDSYTSSTKLYKATALLHETIHAYMLSVVDDYNTYPTNSPFTNFPELFNIYVNKTNSTTNSNFAQHEDMANKYVNAIASAIEEYQTSTTMIPSSLADKQVFLDMAWSGLQNTDVFDKKFPVGSAERSRILARIAAEINGVYSQGQYAVGKPCN